MYELFDHTADLGLRVRAADEGELFAEAGRAFLAVVVSNPEAVQPRETLTIDLPGDDLEYLLVDWLDELLFRFDTQHFLACRFDVRVGPTGISAAVQGERCETSRHRLEHEVKAVTYHGLRVEKTEDGFVAEVILDI